MNKSVITTIVVAVVVGAAAFFGGMKYQQSKSPTTLSAAQRQQFAGQFRGGTGAARGGAAGGLISGQITSASSDSITVKDPTGSSHIVILAPSSMIRKAVDASTTDLQVGQMVTVTGQSNTGGSVTAQTIQIRQSTGTPPSTVQPTQ